MTAPSIWDNSSGSLVPPGTPQVKIRYEAGDPGEQDSWLVYADEQVAHRVHTEYFDAHRWAQNKYHLTSTPMTVVYQDYQADMEARFGPVVAVEDPEQPAAPAQNKYRKEPKA